MATFPIDQLEIERPNDDWTLEEMREMVKRSGMPPKVAVGADIEHPEFDILGYVHALVYVVNRRKWRQLTFKDIGALPLGKVAELVRTLEEQLAAEKEEEQAEEGEAEEEAGEPLDPLALKSA